MDLNSLQARALARKAKSCENAKKIIQTVESFGACYLQRRLRLNYFDAAGVIRRLISDGLVEDLGKGRYRAVRQR